MESHRFTEAVMQVAAEGAYLVEFSNGNEALGSIPPDEYRAGVGAAILQLHKLGLIRVGLATWPAPPDATVATVGHDELRRRVSDGSAWNPERSDLLVIGVGEGAHGPGHVATPAEVPGSVPTMK